MRTKYKGQVVLRSGTRYVWEETATRPMFFVRGIQGSPRNTAAHLQYCRGAGGLQLSGTDLS